jgi:hypothetical protein
LIKHKSPGSLLAALFLCLAVLISPLTANADSSDGLTLTVAPSVTTASLGENISYNYVITSTCNTTVDSLVLTDDKFGTISLPATSIATGDNISASVTYTVVSGDFPGPISNTATVTGVSVDNATLSATAGSSVTLNQTSSIQVSMSAGVSSASVGDDINYTYTITNNGEAALNGLVLTDSRLGDVTLSATTLASGSSLTATKIYTVLSSDQPGPLTSNATATATSATGTAVTAKSADVSVSLATWIEDILTKAGILRNRGVPGKGIDHAPGLQKPFNPNSHMGSDNGATTGADNSGNGNGKGNSNGKGKNK